MGKPSYFPAHRSVSAHLACHRGHVSHTASLRPVAVEGQREREPVHRDARGDVALLHVWGVVRRDLGLNDAPGGELVALRGELEPDGPRSARGRVSRGYGGKERTFRELPRLVLSIVLESLRSSPAAPAYVKAALR